MSNNPSDSSSPQLLVSSLGVHLNSQSRKEVDTIIVKAGEVTREICQAISPGGGHQELFDPPLEVSLNAKFSVSVYYRMTLRGVVPISLDPQEVLCGANEEDGKQLYRKTQRNVEVVIEY